MKDIARWKGLAALVGDAVEHGAAAIERVHLETARRPFAVLEHIPGLSEPARGIHQVHDAIVATAYGGVRLVSRAAVATVDAALSALAPAAGEAAGDEQATAGEAERSVERNAERIAEGIAERDAELDAERNTKQPPSD